MILSRPNLVPFHGSSFSFGAAPSPFGDIVIGWSGHHLVYLAFAWEEESLSDLKADCLARFPGLDGAEDSETARLWSQRVFAGDHNDWQLAVRGTNFQQQVWAELLRIPEGETRSYGELAEAIGRPQAVRAVGTAVGANPVAWVIPCHRVLRQDGSPGGYRWGLECKARLLQAEQLTPCS